MTQRTHDPGKLSVCHVTFHVMCLSIFVVVFNCHMCMYPHLFSLLVCFNIFKLLDHCNWLAAVVVFLPNLAFIIHVLIPLFFCMM